MTTHALLFFYHVHVTAAKKYTFVESLNLQRAYITVIGALQLFHAFV